MIQLALIAEQVFCTADAHAELAVDEGVACRDIAARILPHSVNL
jgi:hypothetical protein